jgi:integrase
MHKLWRHANGTFYVLYGPRLRRRVSTGAHDRAQAERFLAQFIAGSQEPALSEPTVGEILAAYRDDHGKGLRGQDGLKYGVAALTRQIGDLKPDHLTPTQIKRYSAQRGASAGTILREIGILRAALGWATDHKIIGHRPHISNPVQPPPPRERWLTKEEANQLVAACTAPHLRLFVILALATVPRMGALLEARWHQIDWEAATINFGRGHGNKRRAVVPLNGEALKALKAAREMATSEWIVEYHGRRVATIKRGFAAACRRAGIEDVTPHILRHSGATWMAVDGVPLSEIARMLGDSERTVERVYAKHTPAYLRRASGALQFRSDGG